MSRARFISGTLTLLAVLGNEGAAQASPIAALSLPLNGAIECQAIPDPEGWILEFTDSVKSFSKRETTLAYDPLGNPLTMAVLAIGRSAEGKNIFYIVVARFRPTAEGAVTTMTGYDPSFVLPLLREEDSIENLPQGWKRATAAEVKHARGLALDFWKRRCGKDLQPPQPSGPPITD